jgi:hypothetical protein
MARTLAIIFGIVFVLVGIMGFMDTPLAGEMGIFQTDTLHDLVHILFGLILLGVAFTAPHRSAAWLTILGIVYLVLAVLGFLLVGESGELLGLVLMNDNDHWLHVFLGVALILAGRTRNRTSGTSGSMPMSSPTM